MSLTSSIHAHTEIFKKWYILGDFSSHHCCGDYLILAYFSKHFHLDSGEYAYHRKVPIHLWLDGEKTLEFHECVYYKYEQSNSVTLSTSQDLNVIQVIAQK